MATRSRDARAPRRRIPPPAARPCSALSSTPPPSRTRPPARRDTPAPRALRTATRRPPRARKIARLDPPIRLRLGVLLIAMVLAFGALGVRLFQLQARDQRQLTSLGEGQRLQTIQLAASRGTIFDRNGVDLAVSVPQTTITADPR